MSGERPGHDVMHLDVLIQACGHFTIQHTNGYGCTHPSQEERDKNGSGSCFAFSCPVACRMLPSEEPLDSAALRERGCSESEIKEVSECSDLMLVHDEAVLR